VQQANVKAIEKAKPDEKLRTAYSKSGKRESDKPITVGDVPTADLDEARRQREYERKYPIQPSQRARDYDSSYCADFPLRDQLPVREHLQNHRDAQTNLASRYPQAYPLSYQAPDPRRNLQNLQRAASTPARNVNSVGSAAVDGICSSQFRGSQQLADSMATDPNMKAIMDNIRAVDIADQDSHYGQYDGARRSYGAGGR
jgi:hypothetical protein